MSGFLIKFLLLSVLVVWSLSKLLRRASRMKGPYGRLASDILRLLEEYGRGVAHSFRWALLAIFILLMVRMAVIVWDKSKHPADPPPEEVPGKAPVEQTGKGMRYEV